MKILFLQDFSMGRKGGGVSIIKRLIDYAPMYNFTARVAFDSSFNSGNKAIENERPFLTLPRQFRYGVGRLLGRLTIEGYDILADASLKRLIKQEDPDVIHLLAHGVSFPAAARAALKSGKKVILSVHDAWSWTVGGYIPAKAADRLFKKLLTNIETVYVISEEMEAYLKELCGPRNYQVVHDGIRQPPSVNKAAYAPKQFSLFYAGIMHSMQLELFARILEVLHSFPDWHFNIGICSNTHYTPGHPYDNITITNYGWVDEASLKKISSGYMFGLLPLSFEEKDALFYRTSLMTKIPFYVSAGLPIICIGPANASAVRFVQREGIGITITSMERQLLHDEIKTLLLQTAVAGNYAVQINRSAATTFNIDNIAARFYNNIFPVPSKPEEKRQQPLPAS